MCFGAFFYLTGIRREWLLQLLIVILSVLVGVLLMVCVWFVVKEKKASALYTKTHKLQTLDPMNFQGLREHARPKKSKLCPKRDYFGRGSLDLQRYGSKTDRQIRAIVILRTIKTSPLNIFSHE